MSVLIETSLGNFTIDLYTEDCPLTCKNFLKLCRIKYYNGCLFHRVMASYVAVCGDPSGSGRGGVCVYGQLYGEQAKYFDMEMRPHLKHDKPGTVSMVDMGGGTAGSQFLVCTHTQPHIGGHSLDGRAGVCGYVSEGMDTLERIDAVYVDDAHRPYVDVRILHTYVLVDPFDDPPGLDALMPAARLPAGAVTATGSPRADRPAEEVVPTRLDPDEAEDVLPMAPEESAAITEQLASKDAKARAVILEMIGDLPDADVTPPENVLFVCKLNPVTTSDDLQLLFARFGEILSCEIIRDRDTGKSLCYGFIEFSSPSECEAAYKKMNNVIVDDRRIKVDFSQSVSKLWNKFRRDKRSAGGAAASRGPAGARPDTNFSRNARQDATRRTSPPRHAGMASSADERRVPSGAAGAHRSPGRHGVADDTRIPQGRGDREHREMRPPGDRRLTIASDAIPRSDGRGGTSDAGRRERGDDRGYSRRERDRSPPPRDRSNYQGSTSRVERSDERGYARDGWDDRRRDAGDRHRDERRSRERDRHKRDDDRGDNRHRRDRDRGAARYDDDDRRDRAHERSSQRQDRSRSRSPGDRHRHRESGRERDGVGRRW